MQQAKTFVGKINMFMHVKFEKYLHTLCSATEKTFPGDT